MPRLLWSESFLALGCVRDVAPRGCCSLGVHFGGAKPRAVELERWGLSPDALLHWADASIAWAGRCGTLGDHAVRPESPGWSLDALLHRADAPTARAGRVRLKHVPGARNRPAHDRLGRVADVFRHCGIAYQEALSCNQTS